MSTTFFRAPQSRCRFGIARCDITPPVGIYHRMWGAASHDRSTGIHRPLNATALHFQSLGKENFTLVSLDHVLLWPREMSTLLNAVTQQTELSLDSFAITFTHTHAAGLMDLSRESLPGGDLIAPYLEELASKVSKIITEARSQTQEACITYGVGHCSLAKHRDFWDEDARQIVCGFNPDGECDDTVLVARVSKPEGEVLAALVNYACHPTTLAWDNTLISPDFPGATCETVESMIHAPCVFLQGASGDVGPRDGYVGDVEVADRNGRQLAFAALEVLESLPPPLTQMVYTGAVVSGATIGTWEHQALESAELARWNLIRTTIDVPYRKDLPTLDQVRESLADWERQEKEARQQGDEQKASDCRAMVERMNRKLTHLEGLPQGATFPYPVVCWRIGDAIHVAVEGELYQWFQCELRKRFPEHVVLVTTLTNGSRVMYLPTAETYGKGIYQESIAVLEAGALEQILESVSEILCTLIKQSPN